MADNSFLDDVRLIYQVLLEREPDATGIDYWARELAKGLSPQDMAMRIKGSLEYREMMARRANPAEYAHRQIDIVGTAFGFLAEETDRDVGATVLATGLYEPHVLPHFVRSIRQGATIVDIGANIGWYSMLAASATGLRGTVHAFEPLPANVQNLLANVRLNRYAHVQVHPYALGSDWSVAALSRDNSSNAHVMPQADGRSILCQVADAGEVLGRLEHIDVLKMDIECHEPYVLESALDVLRRQRPIMFLEYHPAGFVQSGRSISQYDQLIFALGMQVHALLRDGRMITVGSSAELASIHAAENDRAQTGGWLHLDLMLTP